MTRFSFTQPICRFCYGIRYPDRSPTTLVEPERETCCDCGEETADGIYLRVDPSSVRHPTHKRED